MNTPLTHEVRDFGVKETAQEMRKSLRAAFPGVGFSVRMDRGTAHGWLAVSWTDGPRKQSVEAITGGFRAMRFCGMDDAYHRVEPVLYAREDGNLYEPRYSCCGIAHSRHYSDEAEAWAARIVVPGSYWWRDEEPPQMYDPAHFGTRELLAGTDLTDGLPDHARIAYREP